MSFIKLSSVYHPQSSLARIPYEELMEYMALSTYGAYLPKVIESDVRQYVYIMNIYHEAFLCWGFKKALQGKVQRILSICQNYRIVCNILEKLFMVKNRSLCALRMLLLMIG